MFLVKDLEQQNGDKKTLNSDKNIRGASSQMTEDGQLHAPAALPPGEQPPVYVT
jgi:hypothetical protein